MSCSDNSGYLDYSYLEIVRIITEFSFARLTENDITLSRLNNLRYVVHLVVCTTHYFCRQRPKCTVSNCRSCDYRNVVFCGLICVFLETKNESYGYVFKFGMIASVPICVGLGWAYNDMSTGIELIIFPMVSLLIHNMIRLSPMGDTYGLK